MPIISPQAKKAYKDAIEGFAWIRIDDSSNPPKLVLYGHYTHINVIDDTSDPSKLVRVDDLSNLLELEVDHKNMVTSHYGPNVTIEDHDRSVNELCRRIKHHRLEIIHLIQKLERLGYTTAPRSFDDENRFRIQEELLEAVDRLD